MEYITKFLKAIEAGFAKNPYLVWSYLEEGDLLVTRGKRTNTLYIICVKAYVPSKRMISVEFVYSLETDKFVVFSETTGWEKPEFVERAPIQKEVDQLMANVDFRNYLIDKQD